VQLPSRGHPVHTRSLTITATLAEDGSWNARGDIIDLRKCSFVPMSYDIQPAGIIHQMSIDLQIDPETRRIGSIEVAQPNVAVEPTAASRGECCRDPAPRLQQMVGQRIDEDFAKSLSRVFGGRLGCSHLLTLFQLMGSALRRALDLESTRGGAGAVARENGERIFRRAVFVDGFEIDDTAIGVGIQLADFWTRPREEVTQPLERLAFQADARCHAVIARQSLEIGELRAAVRERTSATLGSADWQGRDAEVQPFVGMPIMAGLAGQLLRRFGSTPEHAPLLDCLLQLAPGYIQVMAAVMEKWFQQGTESGIRFADREEISIAAVGGTPDSCYIWRSGGPMSELRTPQQK